MGAGTAKIHPTDVDAAYGAAQRVVETHRRVADFLSVGKTLAEVDAFIAKSLEDQSSRSCFFGYRTRGKPPFPCHACLSLNDCIVHGTVAAHTKPLQPGDLLKVDIGVWYKGLIGDAAWTYSIGTPEPEVRKLMDCGKESIRRGIPHLRPDRPFLDWAKEVQTCAEDKYGFHMVRGLGGHGIGRSLHGPPFISNVVPGAWDQPWPDARHSPEPNLVIAIEPMIAVGTGQIRDSRRGWPIYTQDGSMSVHYEHDVLITEGEPRVLTEGLDEVPDVVD